MLTIVHCFLTVKISQKKGLEKPHNTFFTSVDDVGEYLFLIFSPTLLQQSTMGRKGRSGSSGLFFGRPRDIRILLEF